jgi:hypothetical protein
MPGCTCRRAVHMQPHALLPAARGIPHTVPRHRDAAASPACGAAARCRAAAAQSASRARAGDAQRAHRHPGGGQSGGRPLRPLQAAALQRGPAARHPVAVRAPAPRESRTQHSADMHCMLARHDAASCRTAWRRACRASQDRGGPGRPEARALPEGPRAPSARPGCGVGVRTTCGVVWEERGAACTGGAGSTCCTS